MERHGGLPTEIGTDSLFKQRTLCWWDAKSVQADSCATSSSSTWSGPEQMDRQRRRGVVTCETAAVCLDCELFCLLVDRKSFLPDFVDSVRTCLILKMPECLIIRVWWKERTLRNASAATDLQEAKTEINVNWIVISLGLPFVKRVRVSSELKHRFVDGSSRGRRYQLRKVFFLNYSKPKMSLVLL